MNEDRLSNWLKSRKQRKLLNTPDTLFEGIREGQIAALSSALTLLESNSQSDKESAKLLIQKCLPFSGESIRIGITGVPGVGKSTFIESFGLHLINLGKKVAVLAIDPSSEKSGGSILGDKTRMNVLSQEKNAFIRPTASGNSLGGVARKTRESIYLCESAGFDVILIETVGVGQSETVVHSMVDFFLLLMLAGAGDELQGIKRGIMEMADALVITKADGDNVRKANAARQEYQNAMHLFPANKNNWIPKALTCSALENQSIEHIEKTIYSFVELTKGNLWFYQHRKEQDLYWMHEALKENILTNFYAQHEIKQHILNAEKQVLKGELSSFEAADQLFKNHKN